MTKESERFDSLKPLSESSHLSKFLDTNFNSDTYLISNFEKLKKTEDEEELFEEELSSLKTGIDIIEKNIEDVIQKSRPSLIAQVKNIPNLETKVEKVSKSLTQLEASMENLQENVGNSHQKIEGMLSELKRNLDTKELLRKTAYFLKHLQNLKENKNSEEFDLAKASISIFELEKISDSKHLRGIKVIDKNLEFIRKMGIEIRKKTKEMFENGMETGNQSEIGISLQVYYNLNCLNETVTGTVSKMLSDINSIIRSTIDPNESFSKKKKSKSSKPGSIQRVDLDDSKFEFLNSLREMFKIIYQNYLKIWYLNDVLLKKKDPIRGVFFSELVKVNKNSILTSFWRTMTTLFNDRLHTSLHKSTHLKNLFIDEYCQILQIFTEFIEDFKGYQSFQIDQNENWILNLLEPFEKLYISSSVNKIIDKMNLLFSKVNNPMDTLKKQDYESNFGIPSPDLRGITLTMINELHAARYNQRLLREITISSISKSIAYFTSKIENLIITNTEAYKLYEIPTRFQKFNSNLYNSICQFLNSLLTGIETFSIQNLLLPAINNLEEIGNLILTPFFKPIIANLEKILMKIHKSNYVETTNQMNEMSKYVTEFENLVTVLKKSHLSLFQKNSSNFINNSKFVVTKILTFYMKQICLIQKFSEEGKLLLIQEMSEIELIISSNIFEVDSMKMISGQFKGLRNLLFLETSKISIENTNLLNTQFVLHHLLSRISTDSFNVLFPNKILKLTIEKYSEWLEDHENYEIKKLLNERKTKTKSKKGRRTEPKNKNKSRN
eukprot:gene9810-2135_t